MEAPESILRVGFGRGDEERRCSTFNQPPIHPPPPPPPHPLCKLQGRLEESRWGFGLHQHVCALSEGLGAQDRFGRFGSEGRQANVTPSRSFEDQAPKL